jgi:hypothetical protein
MAAAPVKVRGSYDRKNLKRGASMKAEEHTRGVGAIITNLQALETVLRYFLARRHEQNIQFPKVGDEEAAENYLTRWVGLDKLAKSYNGALMDNEAKFKVDREEVVRIRDAFAHGRLLTSTEIPARLWKFGQAKQGKVKVEFSEELTPEWLKKTNLMIDAERQKVVDCLTARGYQGLR